MSDDPSKSPIPKQKKSIKIGSQRPGYVPDEPKSIEAPTVPAKEKPKLRMAADPQSSKPAEASSAVVEASPGATVSDTASTPDPPTMATSSVTEAAEPQAAPAEVPVMPDVNLEMSDEDLERENRSGPWVPT